MFSKVIMIVPDGNWQTFKAEILAEVKRTIHSTLEKVREFSISRSTVSQQPHPGEDMDVCKCIVPLRHGDTLNSRRAASPLVKMEEGEERKPTFTLNTPNVGFS
ncbi:hypothetical protein TNCV_3933271 [Trichonephila clavipes]|nr:hypothetical protein TNCV_3933271 [Trichonephila clavipes]